jgi:hypothetical protein
MRAKLLDRVLQGASDANIPFDPFCGLLWELGFDEQVQQVRKVILKYRLAGDEDD